MSSSASWRSAPRPSACRAGWRASPPDGIGTWASAAELSGDPAITEVSMSCAPALSTDGRILYVAVSSGDFGYGYCSRSNSKTLAVINQRAPHRSRFWPRRHHDRRQQRHSHRRPRRRRVLRRPRKSLPRSQRPRLAAAFQSRSLAAEDFPAASAGTTPPRSSTPSLVASLSRQSKYLVMTKYNNYAEQSTLATAIIELRFSTPTSARTIPSSPPRKVMREVITQLGRTPDPDFPTFPGAVREWCINTAAVDPIHQVGDRQQRRRQAVSLGPHHATHCPR